MRQPIYVMFLCVVFLSCDLGVEGNPLGIQPTTAGIALHNVSNKSLYYIAFERESTAYIDWRPCTNPSTCDHVIPGAVTVLAYNNIYGYEDGKEVVIYWWRLEKMQDGNYQATNMSNAIVKP